MHKLKSSHARASAQVSGRSRFPAWLPALSLALVTLAVYWRATDCDFISYDDPQYVTSNLQVQKGLNLENIKWAFSNVVAANWHPLSMLCHMLDCQLYGLKPSGHHLTSVLLHALNTVLVFALLRQMTGTMGRSLLAAAVFGSHPLHVESVAWVAERKDVLSGLFGLLSLLFYARYAQGKPLEKNAPSLKHPAQAGAMNYGFSLFFLLLGLLSKPMLVTCPFLMLLLDFWPLERLKSGSHWRLVREKIPFLALAAAASVLTYLVQRKAGSVATLQGLSLGQRSANALVSYLRYLGKMFWPKDLALFYPYQKAWRPEIVIAAACLLGAICLVVWLRRKRQPFLLVGWLWYVGMLVPVIGLVQVGDQAMADRYAYLPSLGVLVLVIWGAHTLTRDRPYSAPVWLAGAVAAVILCSVLTRHQLAYWRDSETVFQHTVEVTKDNSWAHNNLGAVLDEKGEIEAANSHFQEALRISPLDAEAQDNLGGNLIKKGDLDGANLEFQKALRLRPNDPYAHNGLGTLLSKKGKIDDAIIEFQKSLRLKPDYVYAHDNLGSAYGRKGRIDEAIIQFQEALRLKPDDPLAYNGLGTALNEKGDFDGAIVQFQEAVRLRPDFPSNHEGLGAALYNKGRIEEANAQFREARRLKHVGGALPPRQPLQ